MMSITIIVLVRMIRMTVKIYTIQKYKNAIASGLSMSKDELKA